MKAISNRAMSKASSEERELSLHSRIMNFTIREEDFLKRILKYKNDQIVSEQMGIKLNTVRSYKTKIIHKLKKMELSPEHNAACWEMCDSF